MRPIDRLGLGPTYRVVELPENQYEVFVKPPEWAVPNAKEKSVVLSHDQYMRFLAWRTNKELIQHVFPELTGEQREILMNGDPD